MKNNGFAREKAGGKGGIIMENYAYDYADIDGNYELIEYFLRF